MKIQVTGETEPDAIDVAGGEPATVIEVAAALVSSVNGKTGGVILAAMDVGADVAGAAAAAQAAAASDAANQIATHVAAVDPHGDRAYADSRIPLDWVNVKKTYGAKGDGTTDDTAAIQACIDSGAAVYFPPGVYLTRTLEARLGMVLIGAMRSAYAYPVPSTRSATLKLKNGTNSNLLHAADGINNVQISNIAFDGNKANNTSGDIIHLDDAAAQDTSWHLYDTYLDNAPHDGIYIGSGRQAVKTERVWVMRSANNGVTVNGSDTGLHATLIGLSGQDGVNVGVNAWVTHLVGCDIWSSTRNGVNSTAGAYSLLLSNCGIDRHQQAGLALNGGTATVVGGSFHSNSQSGNGNYPHVSVAGGTLTLTGVLFGTNAPSSLPSYCVGITGGTLYEGQNYLVPGATTLGYISDPTKVNTTITGTLNLSNTYQVNVGGSGSAASFASLRANSSDQILSGRVTGNTVSRIAVQADGLHQWSNGAASADVGLNRTGPNLLGLTTADFAIATAGRGLRVAEGTNAKMGTAVLNGTTAVTVSTTAVTSTSRILLTIQAPGGTVGSAYVFARTAGASFQVKSTTAGDTSTVAWFIVEPA
ncbi:glycosyl hydrolase family 28-related protein [Streptomyces sp. NPDC004059]